MSSRDNIATYGTMEGRYSIATNGIRRKFKNEKALYIKLYGDSGLPHGLWVRRFSRLWERCARENGCGRAEERKMYEA